MFTMYIFSMYILFFEDGSMRKTTNISDEDLLGVGRGDVDIIDISDHGNPQYYDGFGHWRPLESAD